VTRLATAPVKGLRMNEREEILIAHGGAVGDREFVLIDGDDRIRSVTFVGGLLRMRADYDTTSGRLEITADDGRSCSGLVRLGRAVVANALDVKLVAAREVVGPWSAFISEVAGRPLRLVKPGDAGMAKDLAPVTLLGEGSLGELERRAGLGPVDPRRFRMLVQFGPSEPHVEDEWEGRMVSLGEVVLRIGATVPRCAATTRHPERGERDAPVVRAIRDYRGIRPTGWGRGVPFGVYAEVVRGGRVRVGDAIKLVEAT
jgi:uncharacterized protein YcbX